MSAEESRSLILRYFQQFTNNHDRSVLRELCSPQILDHDFYAELPSVPEYVRLPDRTVNDVFPDVHDDIEVMAVADAQDRMPEKSTFFFPKPPTGLVMASLEGTVSAPGTQA